MSAAIVVLITAPEEAKALEIARALVGEELAACVNLVPAVRSVYRWEGKICDDVEVLLVAKTRAGAFERLKDRVLSLHPYSCPEVIALPVSEGHAPYLLWLEESVRG